MLSPLSVVEQKLQLGLGYGLSQRSQRQWAEIERQEKIRNAVRKAQQLIELSSAEYESALKKHRSHLNVYAELTLNWSPERVLSQHKDFVKLCRMFQSPEMWEMLGRKERKFIADAVALLRSRKLYQN